MKILVLCTGNSARSILLESILTHRSDGRIKAYSAGSKPAGRVHPLSLRLLADRGFPTDDLTSQSWDDYTQPDAPHLDAVITVCGSAAGEECPYWAGAPLRAHWGVEDPAAAAPADRDRAFANAYAQLNDYAQAFISQPFEEMDKQTLQDLLTEIGTQT